MRAIEDLNIMRKYIKNWFKVSVFLKLNKYPMRIIDRTGTIFIVNNYSEFRSLFVKIKYGINFKFVDNGGDLGETFFRENYFFSEDLKNKTIVDIGANIGDSSVYFALKGASKVLAIEPFPLFFNILLENIRTSRLENIILPLNLMIGKENKITYIRADTELTIGSKATESSEGFKIEMITLSNIIDKYNITEAILKMDCEGCEYDSILNESDETLKKFDMIQIEYHNGCQQLKNKLESIGFEVTCTSKRSVGFIYAKREIDTSEHS